MACGRYKQISSICGVIKQSETPRALFQIVSDSAKRGADERQRNKKNAPAICLNGNWAKDTSLDLGSSVGESRLP
jgi:hypothetical protein